MSENSGKYPSKFPKTQGDVFFYDFIISNFLLLFCSTNREQQKRSWNQWMFDIFLTKWLKQLIDYQHWFNFCQSTKQFCSRYNRLIGPFSCLPSTPTYRQWNFSKRFKEWSDHAEVPAHHNKSGQWSTTISMQYSSNSSSLIQSSCPIFAWFLFWFCQSFSFQTLSFWIMWGCACAHFLSLG